MEERLQKFARLTDIGSFTKAAKTLHISQPALSIAIDKLEQELGTELLVRGNRKLELTEAGRAAYASALEHQNTTDFLRTEINRITRRRPVVTVGMTDSVAAVLCATEGFDRLEEAANVTVVVNNSRYLREAVEQRQLDIAFVVDDGVEHSNLITGAVGAEELILVCHPDLQKRTLDNLKSGKLYNFISYDKRSTTYRHIQQALQSYGVKPHVSLYSTSPDVMVAMALRGKGIGTLPRLLVQDYIDRKALVSLNQDQLFTISRPVISIRLAGKPLPACVTSFARTASIG